MPSHRRERPKGALRRGSSAQAYLTARAGHRAAPQQRSPSACKRRRPSRGEPCPGEGGHPEPLSA
eukprot:2045604-Alexandrium_andersonii.AAC.1